MDFSNLVTGETDESVWLCSVPGGPLRCAKLDGLKLLRGICTMQYFQSFIIVLFLPPLTPASPPTSFNLFLFSVGLSVLNIVII